MDRARDMMDFLELEKSPMNGYQLRALARGVWGSKVETGTYMELIIENVLTDCTVIHRLPDIMEEYIE